ncbi:MAG: YceI family protein [Pseudomonadota bacterium]
MRTLATYLLAALLLAGCAAQQAPPPPAAAPLDTGAAWYQQAAKAGQAIYKIDTAQSLITITVRRGGTLARLGHDHVVASRTLAGFVAPDAGRADFHFRLDAMTVDEPALRSAASLDTQPSEDAIAGTRNNMLTRVLEADSYPVVLLHVERIDAGNVRLVVTLHGVTRSFVAPVMIVRGAHALTASGQLRLLQTDFGITPMSVLGGAMTVQDAMELAFTIVAK